MVRALFFDFDGVVVDTEVPTYESWRQIYSEYGVDLALTDWLPVIGSGTSTGPEAVFDAVTHLERLAGTTLDREAVIELRTRRKTELCDRAELLPGVVDYLAEARRLRLRTAIVTRAHDSRVEHHIARVGLAHAWDAIVCANGLHSKTKAAFYLEALGRLGVESRETIAFEDSPSGVGAAKEAGIRCVAIPSEVTREANFDAADLILDSLAERSLGDLLVSLARD